MASCFNGIGLFQSIHVSHVSLFLVFLFLALCLYSACLVSVFFASLFLHFLPPSVPRNTVIIIPVAATSLPTLSVVPLIPNWVRPSPPRYHSVLCLYLPYQIRVNFLPKSTAGMYPLGNYGNRVHFPA
ncbi:hypothetical protein BDQ94DRAFT_132652 [Aspergillus welwitschiae]|uniref:Uncharacterized protein n=1 Tax=Aspergillus welwitschiae TaxID=1341132 RepID=A0A3F3QJB3_9EURO|nr:hypothetical protein BDQ94DRAFT_132652 [Aspergillus welwitschiae]RDH39205.1 hypothetical protein BDQ94DRAFT_132652 [Aspergillus welwitschiae]